jgi:hypothetical protein
MNIEGTCFVLASASAGVPGALREVMQCHVENAVLATAMQQTRTPKVPLGSPHCHACTNSCSIQKARAIFGAALRKPFSCALSDHRPLLILWL